jgi:integrase
VVADELAAHLARNGRRDGLIFPGHDGRPARLNSFTVAWHRALVTVDGPAGLRLHDLRHSHASALIAAGESVKTVQVRMGHASAMVTLDVYGHLWPDSEERTRQPSTRGLPLLRTPRGPARQKCRSGASRRTSS